MTIQEVIELKEQSEVIAIFITQRTVYYYLKGEDTLTGATHSINRHEINVLNKQYTTASS